MLKIYYHHWHDGNDPHYEHRLPRFKGEPSPKYATVAKLVDTDSGVPFEEATTFCSPKDNPCRKIGREIARGRLFKLLKEKGYEGLENIDIGERNHISRKAKPLSQDDVKHGPC